MRGILLKQRSHQGEILISENWKLPAKNQYPERQMTTFAFYDFEEGTLERMTLNEGEMDKLKLYDEGGEEITKTEIERFFSRLGEDSLTEIEVETESIKKGKMTLETVIGLRIKGTLAIER